VTEIRTIEPLADASRLHIGVVAAKWNQSITDRLVDGALSRLQHLGVGRVTVMRVPGSLELPIGARALADAGCDAVVALGVIIKGDTDHYTIVATESARGLTLVSRDKGIPVTNGVLAVHEVSHAVERAQPGPNNKGDEAATAAVETALTLASLTQPAST
jgi:6,7-dimethyl-8-ribityllumazine synthase